MVSAAHCRSVSLAIALMTLLTSLSALAQDVAPGAAPSRASPEDLRAAAEAYDNGMRRYLSHDYGAASNWFEAADRMAPSVLAVMSAIRAHRQAGGTYHMVRAATLALRLQARYPRERRASTVARATLEALAAQLPRLRIVCGTCDVEVDGVLQAGQEFFIEPGEHNVTAHWSGGRTQQQTVQASAGVTNEITLAEPIPPPPPVVRVEPSPVVVDDRRPFRFPIVVPIVGIGVTAVLGIVAGISWSDAVGRANQLLGSAMTGTQTVEQEAGVFAAEDRTSALLVSTIAAGALTLAAAAFTRWAPDRPRSAATWAPVPGGAAIHGTF